MVDEDKNGHIDENELRSLVLLLLGKGIIPTLLNPRTSTPHSVHSEIPEPIPRIKI